MKKNLAMLEATVKHRFASPDLLHKALTHSSHANEAGADADPDGRPADNEQLEFLGDSVLNFAVSQEFYERYPGYSEGKLSKLRAHVVSAKHLADVATAINLGEFLRLGRGEDKSGGRKKSALLANGVEALIAAIFLDGGFEAARAFIIEHVLEPELRRLQGSRDDVDTTLTDHKSTLQELLQASGSGQPKYVTVKEEGPDHSKEFTVEVRLRTPEHGRSSSRGKGSTRKAAEQNAARTALDKLKNGSARVPSRSASD
jgi:ribonuclease III